MKRADDGKGRHRPFFSVLRSGMSWRITDVRRRRGLPPAPAWRPPAAGRRRLDSEREQGAGRGSRRAAPAALFPSASWTVRAHAGRSSRPRRKGAGRGARRGGCARRRLEAEAPERSGSPFFFVRAVDVNQMRHAGVTAPSCVIRERLDCSPSHVFMRRFRVRRVLRAKKARGAEASRAGTTIGRGMLALAMTAGLRLGRPFQYSPSEAPDVDARLAGSNEPEGGIDPIPILGIST